MNTIDKWLLLVGIMLISCLRSDASSATVDRGINVSFSLSRGVVSVSIANESRDALTYFLPKSSQGEIPCFLYIKVKDSNNAVVSKRDGCDDGYWTPLVLASDLIILPSKNHKSIQPGSTETITVPIDVMLRGQSPDVIRCIHLNKCMFRYVIYFDGEMRECETYESDWFSPEPITTPHDSSPLHENAAQ